MTRQWKYSDKSKPAFPIVEVKLFTPWSASSSLLKETLQIDSGADMTGIPLVVIDRLKSRLLAWEEVFDFDDNLLEDIPVYEVGIEILGLKFNSVRVYGLNSDLGFIGRDLLNGFLVSLDGPNQMSVFT